jgi:lipid-binding SYLF domain-containing protein
VRAASAKQVLKEVNMRRTLSSILVVIFMLAPAFAGPEKETRKLKAAEQALRLSVEAPDKGIPRSLLEKAECIGVFPDLKKGAFVVGGKFGRGVVTCRRADGSMGAPAFFSIGGPSFGWQFGGEEADLVLLIMNQEGVRKLLQDHFTLGAEASAAAGPVGRTTQAATDLQMHAQILSWSRSRGIFLGASLEGTVVKANAKAAGRFYGRPVSAKEILVDQKVAVPAPARSFVAAASGYAKRTT